MIAMEKLSKVYEIDNRIRLEREVAASLIDDSEISKVLSFLVELDKLANQYQFRPLDIVKLISPDYVIPDCITSIPLDVSKEGRETPKPSKRGQGSRRTLKTTQRYQNPHTGELIEVRSANNKALKKWKTEYGADIIDAWRL
jgi:hypothetical protein